MSKGRVWNKGKRNGGGGPPEGSKNRPIQAAPDNNVNNNEIKDSRVDRIQTVKRENWIARPTWVKRGSSDPNDN